jgi:hypothetical protein
MEAACLNAGDAGLNPGMAGNSIPPELGNVGSGKFGKPWWRMHLARASAAIRCDSLSAEPVDRPVGTSLLHVCIADRKAGDCLWMPLNPPGAPRSGKFGTPCDRMQLANLTPEALPCPVPAEILGPLEAPQAPIAVADTATVTPIKGDLVFAPLVTSHQAMETEKRLSLTRVAPSEAVFAWPARGVVR